MIALLWLVACGEPAITGTVTDVTGAPLADARVTVVGKLCQGPTDAAGRFEVSCQRGEHRVAVTAVGFVSREVDVALDDPVDLGAVALVRIPDGEGLFLFDGASYRTLQPTLLAHRVDGERARAWCLVEGGPANPVSAGRLPIFAKAAGDWRAFRLDGDGCARRMEREGPHWKVRYDERPEETSQAVATEQSVHFLTLEPGRYVIAPWPGGNFQKDPEASRPGEDRFRAYLLDVTAP